MQVKDRVFIISGGASGLGEACSRLFAESGAKVGILDLNEEKGEMLAKVFGASAVFYKTDVSNENSVQAAVEAVVKAFGAVHVAINCAGLINAAKVYSKKGLFPMDIFNKVIQVNLIGTMHLIRFSVQEMMKNEPDENGERGVIVNTSSAAAFSGQVGQAAYSASKAGVVGMTLPIAREIGDYGMRIVTIAPGLFETPMSGGMPESFKQEVIGHIPFPKRLGRPVEFAWMARHIVENPYLNGTTIMLDGAAQLPAK
ncbi:SDR family NAD(P)-dependent oxidoreductase [Desulfallas sp. Bu1-1]|uniref:SDR family NAD(P)-dependent oxidoreductase n=1 Tax=Desulfallas sp. Bu1-1 TaxID=2787620 RepID=UPI00189EBFC5|nr:SDR family NAD(P)-dependent oxidoreductase [Desulfallas sp. Bu1-1]MBF7082853.1 SDR family NAD(P)-dependent oxidoreductase [Desulfallas sp. Bu1-1]